MKDSLEIEENFQIYALSEQAVTIEFEPTINERILKKIDSYRQTLSKNPFPGFISLVPGYHTLTIVYNPKLVDQNDQWKGLGPYEKVSNYLLSLKKDQAGINNDYKPPILIPVCYGGVLGPDLQEMEESKVMEKSEIIRLHTSVIYRVYMIGFMPGFAYLGGMDERLAAARKRVPRGKVLKGSVGIAGKQTGIYPFDSPGGWQIIGRTPTKMFDLSRSPPSFLQSGDLVKFQSIDENEFDVLELVNQ